LWYLLFSDERRQLPNAAQTSGDGGIFLWDRDVLGPLEKSNFIDCLKEKQLHMVCYLCELFLGLAVCPGEKTESPGFEAVVGVGKVPTA
jgi:hypothetical protein